MRVIACMIIVFMFPSLSLADDSPTDDWSKSGNYTISWYNKNQTEFTLNTAKELAGMVVIVNNGYSDFEGKTIKLGADIDLSGKNWTPCGTFKGIFDGMGHTINGININIVSEDTQCEFGFWKRLENASVRNLILNGDACIEVKNHEWDLTNTYFGGIVGYCKGDGVIENCETRMDIRFVRHRVYSLSNAINPNHWSYIGGIVGYSEFAIKYCKHIGNLSCELPESFTVQAIVMGGIVGRAGNIQFCENISSKISLRDNQTEYFYHRYIGGICGLSYGNLLCCRSIIDTIEIKHLRKTTCENYTYLGGIVGAKGQAKAVNCYSSISNVIFDVKDLSSQFNYGAIGSDEQMSKACFSNNDTALNIIFSGGVVKSCLYDGSTSFSSSQMQTPAFLEELNMYSMFEMDGPVWTQDAEGGYPYIASLYASEILPVVSDYEDKASLVYSLFGQRLNAPKKGINIVGGRKVIIK